LGNGDGVRWAGTFKIKHMKGWGARNHRIRGVSGLMIKRKRIWPQGESYRDPGVVFKIPGCGWYRKKIERKHKGMRKGEKKEDPWKSTPERVPKRLS